MSDEALGRLLGVLVDGGVAPPDLPAALVRHHRLAPLAHTHGAPGYRSDYIAAGLRVEQQRVIASEAVRALASAAIPAVLLKGVSYAGWLYEDPAERPMTDVDLLVRPAQHDAAVRTLAGLGYVHAGPAYQRSPRHHALTLKRPHAAVDLHRGPTQAGRVAIDEGLWDRTRASTWISGALHLDPLDETLFHFAFLARQDLIGPALLQVDAGRLLRRVDAVGWATLLERASRWRFRRVFEALVALTEHVVGWRDRAPAWWLPGKAEILSATPDRRTIQLARKTFLLGGPRAIAHFTAAVLDGYRTRR